MRRVAKFLRLLSIVPMIFGWNSFLQAEPMKVGVIGLTHTHVHWILGRPDRGDVQIVGIAEADQSLAKRYAQQHGLPMKLVYPSVQQLADSVQLDAVTAFGPTCDHLQIVEFFAPRGVHIMVEKPLAANYQQAQRMAQLAKEHKVHLLTNFETTWYATSHRAYELVHDKQSLGPLRKIVAHAGHRGPKEIGVNEEFLAWLTDPKQNGGGAVTDFGCYGVNLVNWLTDNQRPRSVTAVLKQNKPDVYPHVDDEATIILDYPQLQAIVQASWNWPISRKDIELYCTKGQVICHDGSTMTIQSSEDESPRTLQLDERAPPFNDPFAYFAAVVHGDVTPTASDPSALANNLLVVEILDAAIRSATKRQTVHLSEPR